MQSEKIGCRKEVILPIWDEAVKEVPPGPSGWGFKLKCVVDGKVAAAVSFFLLLFLSL